MCARPTGTQIAFRLLLVAIAQCPDSCDTSANNTAFPFPRRLLLTAAWLTWLASRQTKATTALPTSSRSLGSGGGGSRRLPTPPAIPLRATCSPTACATSLLRSATSLRTTTTCASRQVRPTRSHPRSRVAWVGQGSGGSRAMHAQFVERKPLQQSPAAQQALSQRFLWQHIPR